MQEELEFCHLKDDVRIDGQVSFLCPRCGAAGPWEDALLHFRLGLEKFGGT